MRVRRTAGKRERHTPMIVVRGDRRMSFAIFGKREPQRFFGPGLADRTSHADDLGLCARPAPRRGKHCEARGARRAPQATERPAAALPRKIIGDDCKSPLGPPSADGNEFNVRPGRSAKIREKRFTVTDSTAIDRDTVKRSAAARPSAARRPWRPPFRRRSTARRAHAANSLSAAATAS